MSNNICMVPTWTGKHGKVGNIFSQGILKRLEKSWNFTQNTAKVREFYSKYWENEEFLASFFSDF